jgi:hypothetical protein
MVKACTLMSLKPLSPKDEGMFHLVDVSQGVYIGRCCNGDQTRP